MDQKRSLILFYQIKGSSKTIFFNTKNNSMETIPAFAINLKKRADRKLHLLQEFENRKEFSLRVIEAVDDEWGARGLWNSIVKILREETIKDFPYVLICEDDHVFTDDYNHQFLLDQISDAIGLKADFINGGPSGFNTAFPINENLFWVDDFSGSQFLIIFSQFYSKIIDADFNPGDTADHKLCDLTNRAFYIYPFVSVQRDFGYSDATLSNDGSFRIDELYRKSSEKARTALEVSGYYNRQIRDRSVKEEVLAAPLDEVTISTYIITQVGDKPSALIHIHEQFEGRNEFDITYIQGFEHELEDYALWLTFRKIVDLAIANQDDVIVISQNNHQFTPGYSKQAFLRSIIWAHHLGMDYLNGGAYKFDLVVPLTPCLYWTNLCLGSQFIILFRSFFPKILSEPFDKTVMADRLLSEMTPNKMLFFPYLSDQKNFIGLPKTESVGLFQDLVIKAFANSVKRLEKITDAAAISICKS
jgi:hypothetical protein